MALPNIFEISNVQQIIERIQGLSKDSKALWGRMNAAQMLAHCNVTYDMVYNPIHTKPNFIMRLLLHFIVKKQVVNETPYKQNSRTATQYIIKGEKNFEVEKNQLINHLTKTQELGKHFFEQLPSHSFGPLSADEWNNLFYKHLDHHLRQFGV